MPVETGHVKQLLSTARTYRRPDMLGNIVREVHDAEMTTGTSSAELRLLCAEVSVELKQWPIAAELLKGIGSAQETRLLALRRVYCEVLVSLHHVDEKTTLSEDEKVHEYVGSAARVVQALAEAVELWPESLDTVLAGIRTLWLIVSPLLTAGHEADVCDTVAFLATFHQQLHIGGGYTLVQWLMRAALCLRAADRLQDAVARFYAALEAAALMGNQRLFVQVLRVAAGSIYSREKSNVSSKTRSDFLPSYRSRPPLFAVLLTYLMLGGLVEMDAFKEELQGVYSTLCEGVEAAPPPSESGPQTSRGRKKQLMAKPAAVVRLVDSFTVTEADIIDEVKTDLLFCISVHGTLSPDQVEELERKRHSSNRRVRSFATFALVVRASRRHGFNRLVKCADASSISVSHRAELRALVRELVDVLKNTNSIHDDSERQYTTRVGACLLWNLVLPFLQTITMGDVHAALSTLTDVSQASIPALRKLLLQAGTVQCQLAYDEDNRSVLHQLLPFLQRELHRGEAYEALPMWLFRLQWLQRQITVRDELESNLISGPDRCLFAIEQARWISNPLKRIPHIKTAFRYLPMIFQEGSDQQMTNDVADTQKTAAARGSISIRRSTIQLYRELLELCMQDLSPSLYAMAMAVAEELRGLPCPVPSAGSVDIEEIRAIASLHASTILLRQLEEMDPHKAQHEMQPNLPPHAVVATAEEREDSLGVLLLEAAKRGAELESRRRGSGGWIAANACVTFLKWKKNLYARGEYRPHLQQLLELQKLYTSLFELDHVQDAELLSDLTASSVLGLTSEYLETSKHSLGSVTSSKLKENGIDGFTTLVQRIRTCGVCEPSNQQLRRALGMCLEVIRMIPSVKQKWFLAVLSPALARLVNDKTVLVIHPQEQLLVLLGVLAGPSSITEKTSLLLNDVRTLLRKDPCMRLCAWVATVAMQLQLEEVALECCEMADKLYASNRMGWGSLFEFQTSPFSGTSPSASIGKSMEGGAHKKLSLTPLMVQTDVPPTFPKPDAEDWEAYSELLSLKARLRARHLYGLNTDTRSRAVKLLLTNCVNSAIAAAQGPAASKVERIMRAYDLYYHFLRTSHLSLENSNFLLPSLRMLLSKALLAQIPKRHWSESFTDIVYQLGCVLVYVTFTDGQADNLSRMPELLRSLREFLPPRYQKTLKAWEVTQVCYRNPTIDDFLQRSKNMEAELQVRGWMIVAQSSNNEVREGEAFALALAASQGSSLLRAQCLYEHAYTTTLHHGDSTPLSQVTRHLQEALRILEGLPEAAPLLQTSEEVQSWHATLSEASMTASFLATQTQHLLSLRNSELGNGGTNATQTHRSSGTLRSTKRNKAKFTGVSFHHSFLGLHIVSLLFKVTSDSPISELGTASLRSSRRITTPASRRDCANVMLDYIFCLWQLSAKWLLDKSENEDDAVLKLPVASSHFYGFTESSEAAQRLRSCVPGEEFILNTKGLWQCLLDLGDYLACTGNESLSFMVYSWVRFASTLAFGVAKDDSRSALVQRLCNWKMCAAASSSGLSDSPYVEALSRLGDVKAMIEEAVKRSIESRGASPSWEALTVVSECELRVRLAQTEEAAVLAEDVLCRGLECAKWNTADIRARALRVRACHEALCSRHLDSLRTLQQAFELIGAIRPSSTLSIISVHLWIELCGDRLDSLIGALFTAEAMQWAVTVREQLQQWYAGAVAAANAQADTVHAKRVVLEVEQGLELWARRLFTTVVQQLPLTGELSCPPTYSFQTQLHLTSGALLREIPLVTEGCTTLLSRLYTIYARWHSRDRVTTRWLAQHGANVSVVRERFLLLLAELRVLDELSQELQTVNHLRDIGPGGAAQEKDSIAEATSMTFWHASILYYTAGDRLEASQLASCLLDAFRRLSMRDLGLPTSNGPAHCEREVLKFFRGAALTPSAVVATDEEAPIAVDLPNKISARWHSDLTDVLGEFQQVLQHYDVPDLNAPSILLVASIPALLEKAASHCRQWPHTRLATAILVTATQIHVLQRVEDQLSRCDDLAEAQLREEAQEVLTAAWNHPPIIQVRADKAGSRTRKSLSAWKASTHSEMDLEATARGFTEEEEALMERISSGIQVAVGHGHFDMAAQLSGALSYLAVFCERHDIAAAASEQRQTCQLVGLLWRSCVGDMIDSPEGRLWRQMRAVPPFFTNCTFYKQLAEQVMLTTPMERSLRSCRTLCVVQDKNALVSTPIIPTKGSNAVEVSPYAIDNAILSVAMDNDMADFCIVTLRHPDGNVEARRKYVPSQTWEIIASTLRRLETQKLEKLGSGDGVAVGSAEERVTTEDLVSALDDLNVVATELFGDFQSSLHLYCEKSSLYLCLAPELQPFPWEQTGELSCCSVILRELGAAAVISKMGTPQRPGKRVMNQAPKQGATNSTKAPPSGPLVSFIDMFGDNPESVVATCGTDPSKSKVPMAFLLTCSSAGVPPDAQYLTWMLRDAVPGSLVVNTCGSLIDAIPWSHLASLRFTQLNCAILADGASNRSSQQREERSRLSASMRREGKVSSTSEYPRWMVQTLFLLRGSKFVAANSFVCSPSATDGVARRCLTSTSSGRAVIEQLRGKVKDAKAPFVTLYGVLSGGPSKGKA